jgi:multiple sugar transport system permease protein
MAAVTRAQVRQQRRRSPNEVRNVLKGLLFISPWLFGFFVFTIYPILASFYYSFTRYDIISEPHWIGLANYQKLLFEDETFRIVLWNTLYWVILAVPIGVAVAFFLAALLNNEFKFRPFFRTIFFLPSIVPTVAAAMVWLWIYNPRFGLINSTLAALGLQAIPWLSSPDLVKPSFIIVHAWAQGAAMVIFLAALQDVPRSLYDAAVVDGANRLQRFWHITIPMCTPAILFVLLTGLIGAFQNFNLPWIMTQGGPLQASEFYGVYLYRVAFRFFKMGYASALAWLLFIVIILSTVALFRTSARWVYYAGEEK